MLLDVLTLLGALYVLITVVEYLCSLVRRPVRENKNKPVDSSSPPISASPSLSFQSTPRSNILCACGRPKLNNHRVHSSSAEEIFWHQENMATDQGGHAQPLGDDTPNMDQYQSEILKRRKRLAAGEVKGFYMNSSSSVGDIHDAASSCEKVLERQSAIDTSDFCPEHSGKEGNGARRPSMGKENIAGSNAGLSTHHCAAPVKMVGLRVVDAHEWPGNVSDTSSSSRTFQPLQNVSPAVDRRSSLDTIAVKLSPPISGSSGPSSSSSPFKISENSAFTPIHPKREVSQERSRGGVHSSRLIQDVSDSGVATASAASSAATGPIQITVVMRPPANSGSGQQQQASQQKVASKLVWTTVGTSDGQAQPRKISEDSTAPSENRRLSTSDNDSTKNVPQSPVKIKMVQNVTAFQKVSPAAREPANSGDTVRLKMSAPATIEQKLQQSDAQPAKAAVQKRDDDRLDEPIKLKIIQPLTIYDDGNNFKHDECAKKPTTFQPVMTNVAPALASTAAMAKATSAANNRQNFYASSMSTKSLGDADARRRQNQPTTSVELTAPQLLKKQQTLPDPYGRYGGVHVDEEPRMALTKAMRPMASVPAQKSTIVHKGNALSEDANFRPPHYQPAIIEPPTSAKQNFQPKLDNDTRPSAPAQSGQTPSFQRRVAPVQHQPPPQQPVPQQLPVQHVQPNIEDWSNSGNSFVVWRPKGAEHQSRAAPTVNRHALSVDEGMAYERSRSRERSRVRRQAAEETDPTMPNDVTSSSPREVTDQGVPTTDEVIKGGNVTAKTKLFETLAEHEQQDVDTQHQYYTKRRSEHYLPKHKKMERSHTVHTVRSLIAPDTIQYENAPSRAQQTTAAHDRGFLYQRDTVRAPEPHSVRAYEPPGGQTAPAPPQQQQPHSQPQAAPRAHHFNAAQPENAVFVPAPVQRKFPPPPTMDKPMHQPTQQVHVHVHQQHQPQPLQPYQPQQQPRQQVLAGADQMEFENDERDEDAEDYDVAPMHEDEMSKMSMVEKAKLFEAKAREASRSRRRYSGRHKTQPVTTEEVLKARSVITEQLSKPALTSAHRRRIQQKPLEGKETYAGGDEADVDEDDDDLTLRSSITAPVSYAGNSRFEGSSGRFQQNTETKTSNCRIVEPPQTDEQQPRPRQRVSASPSASGNVAPSPIRPRKVVYLHAEGNENIGSSQDEDSQPPPSPSVRQQPPSAFSSTQQDEKRDELVTGGDQNNNEDSERPLVSNGITVNFKKPSPLPRLCKSISPGIECETEPAISQSKNGVVHEPAVFRRISVKDQSRRIADELKRQHDSFNGNRNSTTVTVTVSDQHFSPTVDDHSLSHFCSRIADANTMDNPVFIDDDSFMSVIKAPIIRLTHFERPKPNRRHSSNMSSGNADMKQIRSADMEACDIHGAIIVND